MAITAETRTDIIELVVGMFGAAPGASVLTELAEAVDAGLSLKDLAITLGNSSVFKTEYPSFLTNEEFSTNYLTDLFGGNPGEVSSDNFTLAKEALVSLLNSGISRGEVVYRAVTAISGVAETDTNFGTAAARLNNETEVAEYYTVTKQLSGDTLDELKSIIINVTSSDATVTTAKASVDVTESTGTSFSLTTGVDSFTGGTGNDTFNGANGTTDTYTVVDTIDGGAGTDTISLVLDAGGTTLPSATVSNVEVLKVRDTVGATLDLGLISGLTTVQLVNSSAATSLSNFDTNITGLSVDGIKGDVTIGTAAGGSSATTLNLTTSNVSGTAATNDVDFVAVDANSAITTLNVTTNGTSSYQIFDVSEATKATFNGTSNLTIAVAALEALTSITVAGSGAVTIADLNTTNALTGTLKTITVSETAGLKITDALDTLVETVDASATSGVLSVRSGANTTSITGGSGNDTVDIDALVYSGTAKLNGGAGTDTLSISESTATVFTTAAKANISNFETLDITGSAGGDTFDFTALSGLTGLSLGTNTGAVTITKVPTSVIASGINVVGSQTTLSFEVVDATSPTNTTDSLALTLDTSDGALNITGTLGADGVETLNLTVNKDSSDDDATIAAFAANTDFTVINVTGAGDTIFTSTAAATALGTIAAGDATGDISVVAVAATKNLAITTGSGADDINGSGLLTAGDVLSAGAGIDRLTGNGGADKYTGGSGMDTFEVDVVSGATTVTVNTITDFEKGSSGDQIEFSVADLEALTVLSDLTTGDGTSIATDATPSINEIAVGTGETLAAGDDVLVFTGGTFATAAAFKTAIVAGGATALTWGAAPTAADGILAVYSDGTDTHVALISNSGTTAAFQSAEIDVNNLVTLSGISSIAALDFVSANFEIIA